MFTKTDKIRKNNVFRTMIALIITAFLSTSVLTPGQVWAQSIINLPAPGTMISPTPGGIDPTLLGITIHPENPLAFDFIVDRGQQYLEGDNLREISGKLINYFFAALTVPEDELWVNLSPYENNRIIANGLGDTEMGRDMLAQDYLLKQLTASLMYPEDELGSEFWQRIQQKSMEKFGTVEIPANTFNKVWIVPQTATVFLHNNSVFVSESYLKVMLEEDYAAVQKTTTHRNDLNIDPKKDEMSDEVKQIIRDIIIPEIENEVNEGETFANLRQIFNSMILATWYKKNLKESIFGNLYIDQNKVQGIDLEDKSITKEIYNQYIEAFKVGVFDMIKEDYDPVNQTIIPRKYFSGGVEGIDSASLLEKMVPSQRLLSVPTNRAAVISANINPLSSSENIDAAPLVAYVGTSPVFNLNFSGNNLPNIEKTSVLMEQIDQEIDRLAQRLSDQNEINTRNAEYIRAVNILSILLSHMRALQKSEDEQTQQNYAGLVDVYLNDLQRMLENNPSLRDDLGEIAAIERVKESDGSINPDVLDRNLEKLSNISDLKEVARVSEQLQDVGLSMFLTDRIFVLEHALDTLSDYISSLSQENRLAGNLQEQTRKVLQQIKNYRRENVGIDAAEIFDLDILTEEALNGNFDNQETKELEKIVNNLALADRLVDEMAQESALLESEDISMGALVEAVKSIIEMERLLRNIGTEDSPNSVAAERVNYLAEKIDNLVAGNAEIVAFLGQAADVQKVYTNGMVDFQKVQDNQRKLTNLFEVKESVKIVDSFRRFDRDHLKRWRALWKIKNVLVEMQTAFLMKSKSLRSIYDRYVQALEKLSELEKSQAEFDAAEMITLDEAKEAYRVDVPSSIDRGSMDSQESLSTGTSSTSSRKRAVIDAELTYPDRNILSEDEERALRQIPTNREILARALRVGALFRGTAFTFETIRKITIKIENKYEISNELNDRPRELIGQLLRLQLTREVYASIEPEILKSRETDEMSVKKVEAIISVIEEMIEKIARELVMTNAAMPVADSQSKLHERDLILFLDGKKLVLQSANKLDWTNESLLQKKPVILAIAIDRAELFPIDEEKTPEDEKTKKSHISIEADAAQFELSLGVNSVLESVQRIVDTLRANFGEELDQRLETIIRGASETTTLRNSDTNQFNSMHVMDYIASNVSAWVDRPSGLKSFSSISDVFSIDEENFVSFLGIKIAKIEADAIRKVSFNATELADRFASHIEQRFGLKGKLYPEESEGIHEILIQAIRATKELRGPLGGEVGRKVKEVVQKLEGTQADSQNILLEKIFQVIMDAIYERYKISAFDLMEDFDLRTDSFGDGVTLFGLPIGEFIDRKFKATDFDEQRLGRIVALHLEDRFDVMPEIQKESLWRFDDYPEVLLTIRNRVKKLKTLQTSRNPLTKWPANQELGFFQQNLAHALSFNALRIEKLLNRKDANLSIEQRRVLESESRAWDVAVKRNVEVNRISSQFSGMKNLSQALSGRTDSNIIQGAIQELEAGKFSSDIVSFMRDRIERLKTRIANDRYRLDDLKPLEKKVNELSEKIDSAQFSADAAQIEPVGGIDFNPASLQLNEMGTAPSIHMDNSMLQKFLPDSIDGIVPVIINITPVANFPMLLGMNDDKPNLPIADSDFDTDMLYDALPPGRLSKS